MPLSVTDILNRLKTKANAMVQSRLQRLAGQDVGGGGMSEITFTNWQADLPIAIAIHRPIQGVSSQVILDMIRYAQDLLSRKKILSPFIQSLLYTQTGQKISKRAHNDLYNILKPIWDNKDKQLSVAVAKDIIAQIILGVEYLRNNNIVHRDLKPENIFVVEGCNFIFIACPDGQPLDQKQLEKVSQEHGKIPVVIKKGDKYFLYGAKDGKQWKITELDKNKCGQYAGLFPKLGEDPKLLTDNANLKALYDHMVESNAHKREFHIQIADMDTAEEVDVNGRRINRQNYVIGTPGFLPNDIMYAAGNAQKGDPDQYNKHDLRRGDCFAVGVIIDEVLKATDRNTDLVAYCALELKTMHLKKDQVQVNQKSFSNIYKPKDFAAVQARFDKTFVDGFLVSNLEMSDSFYLQPTAIKEIYWELEQLKAQIPDQALVNDEKEWVLKNVNWLDNFLENFSNSLDKLLAIKSLLRRVDVITAKIQICLADPTLKEYHSELSAIKNEMTEIKSNLISDKILKIDIQLAKNYILQQLSAYKAVDNIFTLGYADRHEGRMAAVKNAIQAARDLDTIKNILANQLALFEGKPGDAIPEITNDILDVRWSVPVGLKHRPVDPMSSSYYRTILNAKCQIDNWLQCLNDMQAKPNPAANANPAINGIDEIKQVIQPAMQPRLS